MNKYERHIKIIELVNSRPIKTQEEIVTHLKKLGCNATQATVSRDIKELALVKIASGDGYQYAVPKGDTATHGNISARLGFVFGKSVTSVDSAQNIVVVHTLPGMANAAASAVDAMKYENILGCIAGDDTFMVVARDDKNAADFAAKLEKMIHQ